MRRVSTPPIPADFLIGHLDGEPIGCVSAVSYPGRFGFIGLYIIVPRHRGKGYGIQLWRAAMARLAGHNVGLDGVPAQQDNYRRSGFRLAYSSARYERGGPLGIAPGKEITAAAEIPFPILLEYDRQHFPALRESFLRQWLAQPDSLALAHYAHGRLQGYGVIRRCVRGHKIGPLFADHAEIADQLYLALCRQADNDEPVFLDVPEVNVAGMRLAEKYGMRKVFGTARMYTGEPPSIAQQQVFGVTTFELG